MTREKLLVHCSDWHLASLAPPWRKLVGRRLIGYLRWRLLRGKKHGLAPLLAFCEEIRRLKPHQIIVTGDLTHLGLPEEFTLALSFLQRLGRPERVSIAPGNHDSYAPEDFSATYGKWGPYLEGKGPLTERFPRVRILGRLALVGLSTACPNVPPWAIGWLGLKQLERLAQTLASLRKRGFFRVLYLHHPPLEGVVSRRKALKDALALQRVLVKEGAELVLYGHTHRVGRFELDTLWGRTPVFGVSSLTYLGSNPAKRARFFLFRIDDQKGTLAFQSFGWDGVSFRPETLF